MAMEVLMDSDSLIYKAGFAAELAVASVGGLRFEGKGHKAKAVAACEELGIDPEEIEYTAEPEPLENALQIVKAFFETTMKNLEVEKKDIHVLLSDSITFRHKLASIKPYKANRDGMRKPYWGPDIRRYLETTWSGLMLPDMEADDLCSLFMGENKIIASIDKDLDTVPGDHYNWSTRKRYDVTEWEAVQCFWKQVFQGDSGDNIPGLPFATEDMIKKYSLTGHARYGVGAVNAQRLVGNADTTGSPEQLNWELFLIAKDCFTAAEEAMAVMVGHDELVGDSRLELGALTDLLEIGRLLHMTREIKEDGSPILWELPTERVSINDATPEEWDAVRDLGNERSK